MENPFAGLGSIVFADRFVGRKTEIDQIRSYVFGERYNSVAVMGLPRIGKSSLVWEAIKTKEEELNANNSFVIWFSLSKIDSSGPAASTFFFRKMAVDCHDELSFKIDDPKYDKIVEKIIKPLLIEKDLDEIRSLVFKYFKYVRSVLRLKIIFILDEFDFVKKFFKFADFQFLRELAYTPDVKVCLVTTSRETLQEIETIDGSASNFYGIFSSIRLGMYCPEDVAVYWERVKKNIPGYEALKKTTEYYVGAHPYLLDVFNDMCFRLGLRDAVDFEQYTEEITLNLGYQFDSICSVLSLEKLLDKSAQIVIGPLLDVSEKDLDRLQMYGFIREIETLDKLEQVGFCSGYSFGEPIENQTIEVGRHSYICFSLYFTQLLKMLHSYECGDYWKLWEETELGVRSLVKDYLLDNYSDEWEKGFPEKRCSHPEAAKRWNERLDEMKATCKKYCNANPRSSNNPIDYSYPMDLWELFISKDKDYFCKIFEEPFKEWGSIFGTLNFVRNCYAHSNRLFVSEEDAQKAISHCKKILGAIKAWEERRLMQLG